MIAVTATRINRLWSFLAPSSRVLQLFGLSARSLYIRALASWSVARISSSVLRGRVIVSELILQPTFCFGLCRGFDAELNRRSLSWLRDWRDDLSSRSQV